MIVLPTSGGAWVNMRGSLWRVANEQMRGATNEESLGAEIVNRYLHEMKVDLQKHRGARRYVDVEREGPPRFPGDPDVAGGNDEDADDHEASDSEPEEERHEAAAAAAVPPAPLPAGPQIRPRDPADEEERTVRRPRLDVGLPEPHREPSAAGTPARDRETASLESGPPASASSDRRAPFPYPFSRDSLNTYLETNDKGAPTAETFTIDQAEAYYNTQMATFYLKKKRPGD